MYQRYFSISFCTSDGSFFCKLGPKKDIYINLTNCHHSDTLHAESDLYHEMIVLGEKTKDSSKLKKMRLNLFQLIFLLKFMSFPFYRATHSLYCQDCFVNS